MKMYIVRLCKEERESLTSLISSGKGPARMFTRARILLKADVGKGGPGWPDEKIGEALDVTVQTVERVRKQLVEEGLEAVLRRREYRQKVSRKKIDGDVEAHLIALACSKAPEGYGRWSLRLLADKMVELGHIESISYEAVRRTPKKNALKPWLHKQWCIPPHASAAFVCAMEDILTVYRRAFNPEQPLVCMDEISKQFIRETRRPTPVGPGRPARYDYEYERNGVCNMFMFFEPLAGKRHVSVTDRRTKVDWAKQIKDLLDVRYRTARKVTLVMDNLNTHAPASLYEVFEPHEARRLLDRLEIHYTPKHGSWLNMAEIDLGVLTRQCLDRRLPDKATLSTEVAAWQQQRNAAQAKVDWRFTTADARIKLKQLYPTLSS
ncbi:MAG: IS630 family transposase [Euryarchaeota archaeon]|nr:IS630 family transposase [Euryarchaeota archaeon]